MRHQKTHIKFEGNRLALAGARTIGSERRNFAIHLTDSELRDAAIHFTEQMRDDFERSFGFREFNVFLTVVYGADGMTMDQESLMLKHFNEHYDLSRWAIGGPRWSFMPEL